MKMFQFGLLTVLYVCLSLSSIISAMPQPSDVDIPHSFVGSVQEQDIQSPQRQLPYGNNLENSNGINNPTVPIPPHATDIPVEIISNYKYNKAEESRGDGGSPVFLRRRRSNDLLRNPSFGNSDYLRTILSSSALGQNDRDFSHFLNMLEGTPRYDANAFNAGGDFFDDKDEEPIELVYYGKKPQSLDFLNTNGGNIKAPNHNMQNDDDWDDTPISLHTSHRNGRSRMYQKRLSSVMY